MSSQLRPDPPGPRRPSSDGFEEAYRGTPPWDIGRPQPALQELADRGLVRGRVLDVGGGRGEHALMAAALGLEAVGVDLAPTAISDARRRAGERGLAARFLVHDALDLGTLGEQFDTVLDSGLFHVFDDGDRMRLVASLAAAVTIGGGYHLLCFSDRQPGDWGPRRVSEAEIRAAFADWWRIEELERVSMSVILHPAGVPAWRAVITRVSGP